MSKPDHSHEERNKKVVERWIDEVWNQGRIDRIDEFLAPEYVMHYFAMNGDVDLPLYKQIAAQFTTAFTDISMEIEDILVDGDKVTVRLLQKLTHIGEMMGVPPSGKQAVQSALVIYRVKDDKLVESWAAETPWSVTLAALHTS